VYTPITAPIDVPITIVNRGGDTVQVKIAGNTTLIDIAAGDYIVTNSSGEIWAKAQTGSALLHVWFGIALGSSRATESGGASAAEVETIALANTSKQLLSRILLELMINNEYLSRLADDQVTARDLGNGDLRAIDLLV